MTVDMPEPQWIRPAWVALVEILRCLEAEPYHRPVGRSMFQRMVCVATIMGLDTGLKYEHGNYGPFCPDVKKMVSRLQNQGLIRQVKIGRMFRVRVGPSFADARKAYDDSLRPMEPIIDKIADLFLRLDTQTSEVVATVLFTTSELRHQLQRAPSEREVVAAVMESKRNRSPRLSESRVALNVRQLAATRLLDVTPSEDRTLFEDTLSGT